jgi:imidazolonepropionase-like amidohydrolase
MQATFQAALCVGLIAGSSALLPAIAIAQDLSVKAPAQSAPVAIINAQIHPIDRPPFQGHIVFDKGVITHLGEGQPPTLEANTTIITAPQGTHVYPSLIGPFTQLGLTELAAVRASLDFNEAGSITPEATAAVAVNPDSTLLPVTRANGVLVAGLFPSGGLVPGRASAITLDGWTPSDMTIKKHLGVFVEWPMMRTVRAWWMDQSEEDQQKTIRRNTELLAETFRTAKAYIDRTNAGEKLQTDIRWEAMRPVLTQTPGTPQQKLFVQANDYEQILAAIDLKKTYNLDLVIVGGIDAPQAAVQLKELNIPVIVTSVLALPRREDAGYDENYTLPKRLIDQGVLVAISSGEETAHERNLPYAAAMACAHGLSPDQAMQAITLNAAKVLGIDDQFGSLAPGKSATFIITTGSPLETATSVTKAYINGKEISLKSKHTELAEKYREKYRQQPEAKPAAQNR